MPQSPMWLSLMTRWPRNRSTRHRASPITVERMWPTCIGLATLGAEKSITKVRGRAAGGDAQPRIAHRRREPLDQPLVLDPQIDEARPGDLRRLAEIADVEPADDFGGHLARRPAQPLAQRHGEVRLVIAELRVLAAADQFQQIVRIVDQSGQRAAETLFQIGENAHAWPANRDCLANAAGFIGMG